MNKNNIYKITYCGIMCALSVVVMYISLVPSFTYVAPLFSGLIIGSISMQISFKYSLLTYFCTAFLNFILVPEIEANFFFLFIWGHYPAIRSQLSKIKNKFLRVVSKVLILNAAVISAFLIVSAIFGADKMIEGMEWLGSFAKIALLVIANVTFIIYDLSINIFELFYKKVFKPKINKLFH